jgi:hypothetical protein
MSAWVDFGATLNDQTDGLISLASTFLVISVAIGTGAVVDTAIKTPGFSRLVKRAASPFRLPKVVSKDAARGAGRLDRSWKAELRQRRGERRISQIRSEQALSSILRIGIPSALSALAGFLYFDSLSYTLTQTLDPATLRVLALDRYSASVACGRAFVRVLRWSPATGDTPAAWDYTAETGIGTAFPGVPSLVVGGDAAWVAWSESDMTASGRDNAPGRYTRHVEIARFDLGETQAPTELWRTAVSACPEGAGCVDRAPTLDTEGRGYDRMESPALTADGALLRVGWIAWDDGGSYVLAASSSDDGATWSTPARLDTTGGVFGHVPPRWQDGRLYWARLGASGEAEACRAAPDAAPTCVALGSARVASLAPTAAGARLTLDTGAGAWASQEISW